MKTSRQRILDYLQEKPTATAYEISRLLNVSSADARHHLSILLEHRSIEVVGQRLARKRGRPVILYSLKQQIAQNNLDSLAGALLNELLENTSAAETASKLRKVAHRLCENVNLLSYNPTRRVYMTIQYLNQMHYQAHWEAHYETPLVMFSHCPYGAILEQHPEMCGLDTFLLEEMLGSPVTLTAKLTPTPQGLRQCVFQVHRERV